MDTNTLIAVLGVAALMVAAVVWLAYKFRGRKVDVEMPLGGAVRIEGGGGVNIARAHAGRDVIGTDASGGGVNISDADAGGDVKGTTSR